jgi:hypothetical protein
MIVIIGAALWLIFSLVICLFSFWIGRCARKLPIDDHLPRIMSRDQARRCTADHDARPAAPPEPPRWPNG